MRTRVALLAAAGLLAAAAPALAQADYRGGSDQGGGYPPPRGQGGYDEDDRAPQPGARPPAGGYADADQAPPDLGRDLGLRGDQRSALQTYEAATTPSDADERREQGDMQSLRSMTTPQRLDFTAQQMQRDQADFARRADAVRRFYGQLTPQQRRRFDELTGPGQAGADGQGEGMDDGRAQPRR